MREIVVSIPTTAIYNAGAVQIYNALSSLVRFETFYVLLKNALAYYNARVVVTNLEVAFLQKGNTLYPGEIRSHDP
jgi:hypothetical protein